MSLHPCDWVAAEVLTCLLASGLRRELAGGEREIGVREGERGKQKKNKRVR